MYNIIGDIHGRDNWKKVVREDSVNIFVGDYFSPYHQCAFSDQVRVFKEIIEFKKNHPETVLLIGNHDEDHWHIREEYSRFDGINVEKITELFEENKDLFQVAYSIDNKMLVTHAGVTVPWYERYKNGNLYVEYTNLSKSKKDTVMSAYEAYYTGSHKPCDGDIALFKGDYYSYNLSKEEFEKTEHTPDEVAAFINDLWLNGRYTAFDFNCNCSHGDYYGDSPSQGPLWVRPRTLSRYNIFNKDYWQIVGHTQHKQIVIDTAAGIALVDALGSADESLIIDDDFNLQVNK